LRIPGLRSRTIRLTSQTTKFLTVYRQKAMQINDPWAGRNMSEKIFVAFKGRDAASVLPNMTRHGLKFLLYELGARVQIKHLNAELLRHFAVEYLLSTGYSLDQVMQHLGLRRAGNIAKHMATLKHMIGQSEVSEDL